ncbi:MAG TPA: TonB-dependent receptor [Chryseolinea sp.]|nr:TonB-dependent receptor [Chryseolinea sp.]
MKKLSWILACTIVALGSHVHAQEDTVKTKRLDEVIIHGTGLDDRGTLPDVEGTRVWTGKKTEVINVQNLDANISEKTARQIFAKVPGVFVYDMDGTGNQVNIATRGLDPHRGWEFNIRRNDALTNSDMYGYPASHYSMPMEAVERIQLVRGTGSLQYGAQFGGMLNYITKSADTTRRVGFETVNSAGSFGLISTYNAVGGRIGKIDYYGYLSRRNSGGYRDNGRTESNAQSMMIVYHPTKALTIKAEFSHSKYLYQLPGQLTDSMFYADPRQATRSRNYYSPDIYVPSIHLDWKLNENTRVTLLTSAVLGSRNSVMFDKPADVVDAIDPATLTYASRQVDIDNYHSYTSELRVLHQYRFLNSTSTLAAGVQIMNNDMHRRQQGKGTTGSDYDLTLIHPGWGRDLHFKTSNVAFFLENSFRLTDKLSVTPGLRAEMGKSDLGGSITYYPSEELPNVIEHQFVLGGINLQYKLSDRQNLYAGWAQAYRPVILKDIIPSSVYEHVDKNLKDAQGYNFEAGYRGSTKYFRWDVGVFQLRYDNRLGMISQQDENGNFYLFRTNIGNALTRGAELFGEYFMPMKIATVSIFTSTSLMDGRYRDAHVKVGDNNVSVDGNKIESVPDIITRNGVTVKFQHVSISALYSYTSMTYADALNTENPSANGSVGKVPAYGLLDINTTWRLNEHITLRLNINNVTNKQYFTKRPQFYPGPGVWSSDGRSVVATIGFKL